MLRITEIVLQLPAGIRLNPSMGSVMHGALMEIVGAGTAAWLHEISLRPYSQCVYWNRQRKIPVWRIGTLTEESYERIVLPLLNCMGGQVYLRQKEYAVGLVSAEEICQSSYADLTQAVFQTARVPAGVELSLLTTMSFKKDGHYVLWPESYLFYQNLMHRWNTFSVQEKLEETGLEQVLAEAGCMTKYDLHSQAFSLEGRNLYGFCGQMRWRFYGNDMTRRIAAVLLSFAPYAGVGIKTALGMGAVDTALLWQQEAGEK